ncbi:hypothetical protein LPB140_10380 [Sphingorhabdus lutea]|uniref:Uncharacterized protein n=1 Tax=Sphingorhabdus lutea TaxID=1913578 RepID=A0A1L3JDB5_9SPHN|nr:hypothetical protein LPB140_10380 [Sphingorhabdus lutea]
MISEPAPSPMRIGNSPASMTATVSNYLTTDTTAKPRAFILINELFAYLWRKFDSLCFFRIFHDP